MNRRVALGAAAVLAAVLFAVVTTSGGVHLWVEPQLDPAPTPEGPTAVEVNPVPTDFALLGQNESDPAELPAWVDAIIRALVAVLVVVAILAAIAGAVALVVAAWRNRPRLRWRRRWERDADFEVLPDVAAAVVDEADAQRSALANGTPRNAIVRCWVRLERDVASVGLDRDPADTSAEFTERVLAQYSVDADAIHELAALYREARFSRHPLDESARRSALDALDRLHQALADAAEAADDGDPADPPVEVAR